MNNNDIKIFVPKNISQLTTTYLLYNKGLISPLGINHNLGTFKTYRINIHYYLV